MSTIGQRELRNDSGAIMRRVESGESFTVTRNGTAIAELVPHDPHHRSPRPRFVPVDFVASSVRGLPDWGVGAFVREQQDLDPSVDDRDEDPGVAS